MPQDGGHCSNSVGNIEQDPIRRTHSSKLSVEYAAGACGVKPGAFPKKSNVDEVVRKE